MVQIYHVVHPGLRDEPGAAGPAEGGGGAPAPHVEGDGEWSEIAAQALCPPGATIKKDTKWNRWRATFEPFGTKSRAFIKHGGVTQSIDKTIKWCWDQIEAPCPEEWIEALDWR